MPMGAKIQKYSEDSVRFDIYPEVDLDFDGDLRRPGSVGAYALNKTRPPLAASTGN